MASVPVPGRYLHQATVFLEILALFILQAGYTNGRLSISFRMDGPQVSMPGREYTFTCSAEYSGIDFSVQFIKPEVSVWYSKSNTTVHPAVGPYILSTDTGLHEELVDTGRYSIAEISQGNFQLTLIDAQPEDSGKWGCRIIDSTTQESRLNSTTVEVLIKGPLLGVDIMMNIDTILWKNEVKLEEGAVHTIGEGEEPNLYCKINITNVQPTVNVTVGSGPNSRDATDFWTPNSDVVIFEGGRVRFMAIMRSKMLKPDYKDNGKIYACQAYLDPEDVMSASIILNITYKPKLSCPSPVTVPLDAVETKLTCTIDSNPPANVVHWTGPLDQNITIKEQEGTMETGTSTVYVTGVSSTGYHRFRVTATNEHGSAEEVVILNSVISAAVKLRTVWWLLLSAVCGVIATKNLFL